MMPARYRATILKIGAHSISSRVNPVIFRNACFPVKTRSTEQVTMARMILAVLGFFTAVLFHADAYPPRKVNWQPAYAVVRQPSRISFQPPVRRSEARNQLPRTPVSAQP